MTAQPLSNDEFQRYQRQLQLTEIGVDGQRALKEARVTVVGAGGLGLPAMLYLAAAGVGHISIIENDTIDLSNLQRQILFEEASIGEPKVEVAAKRLRELNSDIHVSRIDGRVTRENARELLRGSSVVIDATDNFAARYAINEACVALRLPNVYGSVYRFEGQVSVFSVPDGPCYACIYPVPPDPETIPSCEEDGVLGVVPGLIGMIQAAEALKLILGIGDSLAGRMLLVNCLTMQFEEIRLRKNPECPVCGNPHFLPSHTTTFSANHEEPVRRSISVREFAAERARLDHYLLDVREPYEVGIASIGGVNIPMGVLPVKMDELPRDQTIVVYCHHGGRSHRAQSMLLARGFRFVINLDGGIDAWSRVVDPTVPRY